MLKAIHNYIRLLVHKHKEPYIHFYKVLGFVPGEIKYYEQAVLHRSASVKNENGRSVNNERLEFLGDAILDAVIADILYNTYLEKKEGFLTNTRSKIVKRETLNRIAQEMGLDKLVVSNMQTHTHNSYINGNAFEAIIGAIYLDKGYLFCKHFVEQRIITPYIDMETIVKKETNFKSKLIEWCQKNKVEIRFTLTESHTDDENNPVFQSQVLLNEMPVGEGEGYSKKESQQHAAEKAYKKVRSDKNFVRQLLEQTPKPELELPAESDEGLLSDSL